MTEILFHFDRLGVSKAVGLNLLTNRGVVSDECLRVEDIAEADYPSALEWLKRQTRYSVQKLL